MLDKIQTVRILNSKLGSLSFLLPLHGTIVGEMERVNNRLKMGINRSDLSGDHRVDKCIND